MKLLFPSELFISESYAVNGIYYKANNEIGL